MFTFMNIEFITILFAFIIITVASFQISKLVQKIHLPLITGFLLIGIISGPFVLKMLPSNPGIESLNFVNDLSLAFIAFAAGSELFLKDIRSRIKSIIWITFGQLVVTFFMSSIVVYYIADMIPFMESLSHKSKLSISLLMGTIFVARSPSSAIAVISEMRAKGPFTNTALGVTVIKDVLVIILFTIVFSLSKSLIYDVEIGSVFVISLILELLFSILLGIAIAFLISYILSFKLSRDNKSLLIVFSGFLVYYFSNLLHVYLLHYFEIEFSIEPLLICIVAGFYVANFTDKRFEFLDVVEYVSPYIYVLFFTLTGLSLSFDVLINVWELAILLFFVRLVSIVVGAFIGGILAGDSLKFNLLGWMPFVTQAGVGLGLATIIAHEFTDWGNEFLTLVIAVIVLNQLVGPPLFKWAINLVGEAHQKSKSKDGDDVRDAIIFGYENQSISLAKQLIKSNWKVKIVSRISETKMEDGVQVCNVSSLSKDEFMKLECEKANTIISLLSDEDNLKICEIAYENLGTKNIIVRLNERDNYDKFIDLGVNIVEPSSAMVNLLDHFVRSPGATSILLGMEEGQDTIDIEITAEEIHGMALRNLRFPSDVIILSVHRKQGALVCHGFTRLRLGDIVTVVGSVDSLEKVMVKLAD
jgi:Trk K+ transport system NAD-binding subunit/Kef-type K+ transport system membrane component KefB